MTSSLARSADAMGDVIAGDIEHLAVLSDAPEQDMCMGMAGVMVIDGDPVELVSRSASICCIRSRVRPRKVGQCRRQSSAATMKRNWWRSARPRSMKARPSASFSLGGIGAALCAICAVPHRVRGNADARRPPCSPYPDLRAARGARCGLSFTTRAFTVPAAPACGHRSRPGSGAPTFKPQRRLGTATAGIEPASSLPGFHQLIWIATGAPDRLVNFTDETDRPATRRANPPP